MDHHCPWINNCVGFWNYKSFNLFTLYICLGSLYSVVLHIYCFIQLCKDDEEKHIKDNPHYTFYLIFAIFCFFEGLIFTMFTFEMTWENIEMWWNNTTYIDDVKEKVGYPVSFIEGLTLNLGEDMMWWFLPTLPLIVPNYNEKLFDPRSLWNMSK